MSREASDILASLVHFQRLMSGKRCRTLKVGTAHRVLRTFGVRHLFPDTRRKPLVYFERPTPPTPRQSDNTMSTATQAARITSLDQFRGYSVAGMFVVNFLGGLAITHQLLKHNNTHFSLADSIMPSFIFACGFSFRMTFLKRLDSQAAASVRAKYITRSCGLILLSLMLFGLNSTFADWSAVTTESLFKFMTELLKANMWEVLAIIGATQILLLPAIATGFWTRVGLLLVCGTVHLLISWSFNYDFVYGRPNWFEGYFGAVGKRVWDGGLFGLLAWSEIMLAGTLAYDIVQRNTLRGAVFKLIAGGAVLMLIGYALSCLTTLYDVDPNSPEKTARLAASPVWPDFAEAKDRTWKSLLAEPPLVVPPPPEQRVVNYWMMDKRVVTQSFTLFSSGFAMALYGVFVLLCDIRHWGLGVFRTFGQNPLAAYIIHHMVDDSILALVPKDSPVWWCLLGLVVSFGITYLFVGFLEKRELYLRL